MGQSVELGAGQTASLPAGSYLDAKLTGSSLGIRLMALGGNDRGVAEPRQAEGEVTVRPIADAGSIRLVAVPVQGATFEPGTRIGVELRSGAGAVVDGPQILVRQTDIGAFTSVELARLEYHADSGWRVTAVGGQEAAAFDFLLENPPVIAGIDEREHPWIGPGRYALRRARDGCAATRPTGQPWALVVDSSASMRPLFDEDGLTAAIGLLAGVVAELTGNLPLAAGVTGRSQPNWFTAATEHPEALAPEVLTTTQPASWTLVKPAITEASAKGAGIVAILLDGAPADLETLPALLQQRQELTVLIAVASRSAPNVTGHAHSEVSPELSSFDHLTGFPRLRIAQMTVGLGVTAVDGATMTFAGALTGATA
jgi:hypothetical protein